MEAKYQEITIGEPVCSKLRDIYFSDRPWIDCHRDVSVKWKALKEIAIRFYADRPRIDALRALITYNDKDIRDAFDQGQG